MVQIFKRCLRANFINSGKRAIAYYRYQGIPAEATYTQFEDRPSFDEVEQLADRYIASYIGGQLDRVEVAYMRYLSAARQVPVVETLLPLSSVAPSPAGSRVSSKKRFVRVMSLAAST